MALPGNFLKGRGVSMTVQFILESWPCLVLSSAAFAWLRRL
jgi:hypothetical protein